MCERKKIKRMEPFWSPTTCVHVTLSKSFNSIWNFLFNSNFYSMSSLRVFILSLQLVVYPMTSELMKGKEHMRIQCETKDKIVRRTRLSTMV